MKSEEKHLVFVYGTLRQGFSNHYLLDTSKWVDYSQTQKKYAMFEQGIPFVSKNMSLIAITGEVYEVSNDVLGYLDLLEGHPHAYKREQVDVKLKFTNEIIKAWLYFYPNPRGRVVESGDYNEHINMKFKKMQKDHEETHSGRYNTL